MNIAQAEPLVCVAQAPIHEKPREATLGLRGILRYANKVFHLLDALRSLNDPRGMNKEYDLIDAVMLLIMMLMRGSKSLREFFRHHSTRATRQHSVLVGKNGRPEVMSRSQCERIAAVVDEAELKGLLWNFSRIARKNGVFRDNKIDGQIVGIVDATTLFGSKLKKCKKHCLKSVHRNGTVSYAHKACVLSVPGIGGTGHIVLNYEMLQAGDPTKKQEGELTGTKRLLAELDKSLPGLCDIITGDALYANAPFINAIRETGAKFAIRIKGDQRLLIQSADEKFDAGEGQKKVFRGRNRKGELFLVTAEYDDDFTMPGVEGPIRMVRFTETPILDDGTVDDRKDEQGNLLRKEKVAYMVADVCIPVTTIWKIMHLRWDIEDSCFHVLSTQYHVKHLYSHIAAAQIFALTLLVFNMRELYLFRFRGRDYIGQDISQCDFGKQLEYDLHQYSIAELLGTGAGP